MLQPLAARYFRLLRWSFNGCDDAFFFRDGEDVVRFHLRKALHPLRRGPSNLQNVYHLRLAQSEMKPQVGLRHDAAAAVYFVDLRVAARHHAYAGSDRRAVALGADQFNLDPVLRIAAVVAKKRGEVIHIQNQGVNVAIVIVIAKCSAAAREALADAQTEFLRDVLEPTR